MLIGEEPSSIGRRDDYGVDCATKRMSGMMTTRAGGAKGRNSMLTWLYRLRINMWLREKVWRK